MKIAYITCKDEEEAKKIAKHLINKKIIACANIFPINSFYLEKENLNESKEFVLIAKTLKQKFPELVSEVKKIHSYQIPCILQLEVKANKEYKDWAKENLK